MAEDLYTGLINEFFEGGWRVSPFIKTPDSYIGVPAWPKRAATNNAELQALIAEQAEKTSRVPILGIVPPKGRYVVDIDTKKNPQALQVWKEKVAEAYGEATLAYPNLVVKTKSGGLHLYYSDGSDRLINSPIGVFSSESGVDIRGYTGMVVAPTSVGTVAEWEPGEYCVIKGRPTDPLTVLGLAKILGGAFDEGDQALRLTLSQVNAALRNDTVNELQRHRLLPDSLVIPSSSRDNTLYRCARLCRLADLSQEAASQFMYHVAARCEATPEEPLQHWVELAYDKVRRVYASDTEMRLQTVSALYDELDNAGTVLLRGVSKTYFYFRYGSKLLRLDPRSKYSTDNIGNVLQGVNIYAEDGSIPVRKIIGTYQPKDVAYNTAMYPRPDMPYFQFENQKFVNTYHDPFATFEPNKDILAETEPYIQRFAEFVRHITGYEDGDAEHLLNKLAWIVQRPYRRLPTGTIIYSHTKGSGKDVFMGLVREIVGRQYYMPITLQSIESPHIIMHDKLVCVASEVQLQANARGTIAAASFMGKLKDVITTKTVYVDEKFVQAYSAPIFCNIFLLSNFELSPVLEPGDRRFDIFHATEEKMDQSRFGTLADVTNDGIWVERSARERIFRDHVIYALRSALLERQVDPLFDRDEARMNAVKSGLMENQNPPSVEWMAMNLPPYFTEEVAMMACHFCPMRIVPEYVMKLLREHLGPAMKPLYRSGRTIHRMNGAPRLERKSDGGLNPVPILNFDVKAADTTARKAVYSLKTVRTANPTDGEMKAQMRRWYEQMLSQYYGNLTQLPAQKPDHL
jgi:hypothetical protein